MTFIENLYLKRQLKQLQEENLKLKNLISESIDPKKYPKMRPGDTEGYAVTYPGKPWRPMGSHPSINMPRENPVDLHPQNPLSVDDADTGPTHHPGQQPRVSHSKMPDPNDPLVTSQEKKRRELTDIIGQGGGRYPPSQKPSLKDILASGMPPPRAGAERPTKPYGNILY